MKKSSLIPKPPSGLSPEAKRWWRRLNLQWDFDAPQLLVLEAALSSFDRWREASKIVDAEGSVVTDRFGQRKQHPAILNERDAKLSMARLLKSLNTDIEPPQPGPGRPAGS